jgi:spore germination protein KB
MWMGGLLIKVTVFYYFTVTGLAHWLGTKSHKPFILPAGIVLALLSGYLWKNAFAFRYQLSSILPAASVPLQLGIPLLLLIIALIRGKGRVKGE